MRIPFSDMSRRIKRMIEHSESVNRALPYSIFSGALEGFALFLLLPASTALASHSAVWGLTVSGWLWVFAAIALFAAVANYFDIYRWYDVAMDFLVNVHRKIGDQVAKMPLGWFRSNTSGELSRLVSSNLMTTGEIIAHMFGPMFGKVVAALTIMLCSWLWDWRLGLTLFIAVPLFAGLVFAGTKLSKRGNRIGEAPDIELSSRIIEFALSQGALRSSGKSRHFAPLERAMKHSYASKQKVLWYETAGLLLGGAITQVVVVAMIVIAVALAINVALQPVAAVAFIGLSLCFTTMLSDIAQAAIGLESRRPVLDAIDEILTATPLPEPNVSEKLTSPGTVQFQNVNFSYQTGRPILQNISFSVPKHAMVALVGPSGSGKTTIMRLISRFYDAKSGGVSVGGVDVTRQTTADLMRQLSMVFQDVYLFDDTLEANIRVGQPDASDKEIARVADLAGVSDIAARLSKGLATNVGEGGRALSGGERQRVSIARALLKKSADRLARRSHQRARPRERSTRHALYRRATQNRHRHRDCPQTRHHQSSR